MYHTELEIMALRLERERDLSPQHLEQARQLHERDTRAEGTARSGHSGVLRTARQRASGVFRSRWWWPWPSAAARAREPIPLRAEHGAPIGTA
jgi:hypothetical protein